MNTAVTSSLSGDASATLGSAPAAPNRALRKLCARTFEAYANAPLRRSAPQMIRAGIAGGLPFDSLTSDLFQGCLPATQVCYGSCFAARAAFESGVDFGQRVNNVLDVEQLQSDLALLPSGQGFLRNGWNSDPSWDWSMALTLARLIRQSGRLPVFITKYFRKMPVEQMVEMAQLGAELRISVSAFDSPSQARLRVAAAHAYRDAGGVAVPVIMTAMFRDISHRARQEELVSYLLAHDFPLAENSLRFAPNSPVIAAVDLALCNLTADSGEYWAGRIYAQLKICTLTSVPQHYRGIQSGYLSRNDPAFLQSLWCDPVRTSDEVASAVNYRKPRQCGVAKVW